MWTFAGRDAGDPEPLGEPGEPAVARPVVAPERPLQLDPEAVAPERGEQAPRQRLGAAARSPRSQRPASGPVAGAPGEADEPLGVPLQLGQRHARGGGARARASGGCARCASVISRQRFR